MDFLVELEAVLQTCGPCGEGVEVCKVAVASLQEVSECPLSFRLSQAWGLEQKRAALPWGLCSQLCECTALCQWRAGSREIQMACRPWKWDIALALYYDEDVIVMGRQY